MLSRLFVRATLASALLLCLLLAAYFAASSKGAFPFNNQDSKVETSPIASRADKATGALGDVAPAGGRVNVESTQRNDSKPTERRGTRSANMTLAQRWNDAQSASAQDLLKIMVDALRSNDPLHRYLATRLMAVCSYYPSTGVAVEPFATDLATLAPVTRDVQEKRKHVGTLMQMRCGAQSESEHMDLLSKLGGSRAVSESIVGIVGRASQRDKSDLNEESRLALKRLIDDADALMPLWLGFGEALLYRPLSNSDWESASAVERQVAFQVAMCELGNDCGPNSFLRAHLCYFEARCSGASAIDSLREKAEVSQLAWASALSRGNALAQAIRNRNYQYFGL